MDNIAQQPVDALLHQIRQEEGEAFVFDQAKIREETDQSEFLSQGLLVKLLTIFGGMMASIFFLGFLMLSGLYSSNVAMLIVGLLFIIGSVVVIRLRADTMVETSCVSFNIIGYMLFSAGFSALFHNDAALYAVLAALAVGVLLFADNRVLRFLAVLVLNGSLVGIMLNYKAYNLMHAYIGTVAALLTYMSLREAKFMRMGAWFNQAYQPVRMGLVFTLLAALVLLVHQRILSTSVTHFWLSSLFLIAALLFVVARVLQHAAVTDRRLQGMVYACCCLVLAPTVLTPSIAGALLVMLTSFYIGHRTSFVIGLLALIYFIILYYYDLQLTLLIKSGILVLSGALFIGGYFLLQKHLRNDVE